MSWEQAVALSQVAATVLLGAGVITSLWIGIRALQETRRDRFERVRPRVVFERGGQLVDCELVERRGIPGIDPSYAAFLLHDVPKGAKLLRAKTHWNRLANHGPGSAINVKVTIVTRSVRRGGEEFRLDSEKMTEFPYAPELNRIPATPSHLAPGAKGRFFRLPTPLVVDYRGHLDSIEAVAIISYSDIYDQPYETWQPLRASVDRKEAEQPRITITLSDESPPEEELRALLHPPDGGTA